MSRTAQKSSPISVALKELDKAIAESWPQGELDNERAAALFHEQEAMIASALAPGSDVESAAHAVFLEFSELPAHREAARRWFEAHPRESKKTRFVFDRFDGLARLNRLKEVVARGDILVQPVKTPSLPPAIPNKLGPLQSTPVIQRVIFAQPDIHGNFSPELIAEVHKQRRARPYVFLAFPPKCGGTFIRDILGRIVGAGLWRPGHALGGRDVTPYLPTLALQVLSPTGPRAIMTHAHMIAHYSNLQLLNLFAVRPVVMKRSIPDMLRSFFDHVESEGADQSGGYNWSVLCGVPTDPGFTTMERAAKIDLFVYHQAPWYVQFYASWLRAARRGMIDAHWTSFDAFREEPSQAIVDILKFYGQPVVENQVEAQVARSYANRDKLRFNKGVSGRGTAFLSGEQIAHLHRLAAGYPDVDFVAEGLLPPRG